jgi:hypothetical protein
MIDFLSFILIIKNGVGSWECRNVNEKEQTEIGDVDKTY